MEAYIEKHRYRVLWLLVLFNFLIHIPMINLPPVGAHTWRQVVGYAAARNYYVEDNRFLYPSTDIRPDKNDDGVIYHEFPLTYWLTAKAYGAFGESYWPARLIPMLFNLILMFGAFWLARGLGQQHSVAILFSYLISFSPLILFYAPSFVPNILGLTFFVTGLGLVVKPILKQRYSWRFFGGMFLITLATLSKPTYLFYGLPLGYVGLYSFFKGRNWKFLGGLGLAGSIVMGINLVILRHAKTLHEASPYVRSFYTPMGPAESPRDLRHILDNIIPAVSKWGVEMLISHSALILFCFGIYHAYKNRVRFKSFIGGFWLAWLASGLIFMSLFVVRLKDHDYYLTSFLPIAAFVSAKGGAYMLGRGNKLRKLCVFLLILLPVLNYARIHPRWFVNKQVPETLLTQSSDIVQDIPKNDLILVSGDFTPVVYLYYLNRKGISYHASRGMVEHSKLTQFEWIVHRQGNVSFPSELDINHFDLVHQVGEFVVYKHNGL